MRISGIEFGLVMMSLTAEYAVRALVALRGQAEGVPLGVKGISTATGIPRNYLSKVMHTLVRAGLVSSGRGPGGGFRLCLAPGQVTVYDVVSVFEDLSVQRRCFMGREACNDEDACPAHESWKAVWDTYEAFLKNTTIEGLSPIWRSTKGEDPPGDKRV